MVVVGGGVGFWPPWCHILFCSMKTCFQHFETSQLSRHSPLQLTIAIGTIQYFGGQGLTAEIHQLSPGHKWKSWTESVQSQLSRDCIRINILVKWWNTQLKDVSIVPIFFSPPMGLCYLKSQANTKTPTPQILPKLHLKIWAFFSAGLGEGTKRGCPRWVRGPRGFVRGGWGDQGGLS